MKIRVRSAKEGDEKLFEKLWGEFLKEADLMIADTERNLDMFVNVFHNYVTGEIPGVCLFVAEDAVLLWGGGGIGFDLIYGNAAQGWGTYVRPARQGEGISRALRSRARELLVEMDFTHVLGSAKADDEKSVESCRALGMTYPRVTTVWDLKEK